MPLVDTNTIGEIRREILSTTTEDPKRESRLPFHFTGEGEGNGRMCVCAQTSQTMPMPFRSLCVFGKKCGDTWKTKNLVWNVIELCREI